MIQLNFIIFFTLSNVPLLLNEELIDNLFLLNIFSSSLTILSFKISIYLVGRKIIFLFSIYIFLESVVGVEEFKLREDEVVTPLDSNTIAHL